MKIPLSVLAVGGGGAFLLLLLPPRADGFTSQVYIGAQQQQHPTSQQHTILFSALPQQEKETSSSIPDNSITKGFDLDTALFCGGLAFDAYTEPPQDSSRWEKGVSIHCYGFISFVIQVKYCLVYPKLTNKMISLSLSLLHYSPKE